jgi:hypothetical protein
MGEVKDLRGLTISVWNRYYKQFNTYLSENCLDRDLNQAFEVIILEAETAETVKDAGKIISKGIRDFLKDVGFRKRNDYYTIRELKFSHEWWKVFDKTGVPIKESYS